MSTNPNVHSEFDTTEVKQPTLYAELDKDASDMDVSVIEQEIASDYPENPDADCAKMLRHILQPLQADKPHTHRRRTRLARVAVVLLCVACLSAATVSVARGIGGDSVLQFFSSLLGLSSFSSNMVDDHRVSRESAAPDATDGAWARQDENVFVTYSTQDELLTAFPYYHEGLIELLETYTFVTAYRNTDSLVANWVITLESIDAYPLYIRIMTKIDEESAFFFAYEENLGDESSSWIDDIQLICSENYDSSSIVWTQEPLHCCIWSYLPMPTLMNIAEILITN